MTDIAKHQEVQSIAKAVLAELESTIRSTDSERTIASRAVEFLAARGVTETWYYNCPAFVLLGARSCLSISGREYEPSDELVGQMNLITVDLSPMRDGIIGDCARSFFIENGRYVCDPKSVEFQRGIEAETMLHRSMIEYVNDRTTFEDLFLFANSMIRELGYINLDFLGNLGHSLTPNRDERRFIASGVHRRIADVELFTFEPHICVHGGKWGVKHENVYFFGSDGRAKEL